MSDFHDLIATKNLFNKKICFSQELSKTLTNIHLKIADITKTAKNHKTEKRSKTSKNAKTAENRFEVILVSNKVNIFKRKSFFTKLVLKPFKSLETCSKWTNTAKPHKN